MSVASGLPRPPVLWAMNALGAAVLGCCAYGVVVNAQQWIGVGCCLGVLLVAVMVATLVVSGQPLRQPVRR